MPQNLDAYTSATTLGRRGADASPQGPVASQEAIKELGTNGGGFFNANSAHPFENPTPFTNLLEMLLIFAIPAGLTYTFGTHGRQHEAGLGDLRGDERALLRSASRSPPSPSRTATRC